MDNNNMANISPEELQALRGMVGADGPVPSMQPAPAPQRQMTAQEAMRARMHAGNQGSNPSVMTQGEQYAPQSAQPTPQPQVRPQQSPVANQTIINTTQGGGVQPDAEEAPNDGKSRGFKMNPIMAVGIVIAVLLAVFLGYSYFVKHSGEGSTDGEETSSEFIDPFYDPDTQWITPDAQWEYSEEEIAALRAAGYTGDEIEQYAQSMTPYTDLIKEAEAARDAYIQEAIAPLYDTASDEYKHFISQTWLALNKRTDINEWNLTAMQYMKRENLDYEKIDVYGNQLFIKIYLDDFAHDDWFYCLVTPDEWNKLNDAGNIIVNYTYTTRYVGDDAYTSYEDTDHFYIIDASIEFLE